MYDIESIYEATTIEDAICALTSNPKAKIISGGSDVLIQIREGKLAGCDLVSIHTIPELKGITKLADGTLRIGPATTFSHITHNLLIQKHIPMLGLAVDQVGGPQVRNIGTIGGNICNGVTSADSASTLFSYKACIEISGPCGQRLLPIADFYKGPGRVDLGVGELVTAILISRENYEGFSGHYIKYAMRDAMDIATLGCAVNLKLSTNLQSICDARIAFGVAGPTPMRVPDAERLLQGKPITEKLLEACGHQATLEVNPRTSWRATKDFRLQLVQELTIRALKQAILLGGGTIHD